MNQESAQQPIACINKFNYIINYIILPPYRGKYIK